MPSEAKLKHLDKHSLPQLLVLVLEDRIDASNKHVHGAGQASSRHAEWMDCAYGMYVETGMVNDGVDASPLGTLSLIWLGASGPSPKFLRKYAGRYYALYSTSLAANHSCADMIAKRPDALEHFQVGP